MSKSGKKIDNINELLAMAGPNLNILEEEVDIKVQKEYFEMLASISKSPKEYQEICKQYIENINNLFDNAIDSDVKKRMLVTLATVDDIAVYRAIENFSRRHSRLKKWGVIALQQSRMLIQTNLLDDPGVFISTGLGGQGLLLRYFCVFFNRTPGQLQDFQQQTLKNETEAAITPLHGVIEQVNYTENYITMLMLLPLEADLQPLFSDIIDECNQFGNFLHENMIITNVKKLTDTEIRKMLKTKNAPEELV